MTSGRCVSSPWAFAGGGPERPEYWQLRTITRGCRSIRGSTTLPEQLSRAGRCLQRPATTTLIGAGLVGGSDGLRPVAVSTAARRDCPDGRRILIALARSVIQGRDDPMTAGVSNMDDRNPGGHRRRHNRGMCFATGFGPKLSVQARRRGCTIAPTRPTDQGKRRSLPKNWHGSPATPKTWQHPHLRGGTRASRDRDKIGPSPVTGHPGSDRPILARSRQRLSRAKENVIAPENVSRPCQCA